MLSSSKDTILIIGASGFIGRHIYARLRDSYEVIGTYFSSYSQGLIHLDMTSQQIYDILPHEVLSRIRYAIICSAVGNMEACSKNKEKTFELNVTATLRLIDKLRAYGIRIIYVSTGAVFNGCCGFYKETDAVSPINEYGRQKSQVEAYIASNYPESFIVRLSKVLATNTQHNHLLNEWYQHVL